MGPWDLIMAKHERNSELYGEDGLPLDKSYLEKELPDWLSASVAKMQTTWDRLDAGEKYSFWDCDYADLQSDINIAEVEGFISSDQAWYLREKYLRVERP